MQELEEGLIGALLHDGSKIKYIKDWFNPLALENLFFRQIYVAYLALSNEGVSITVSLIADHLQPDCALRNIYNELNTLRANTVPTDINYYARKVEDQYKRRELYIKFNEALNFIKENKPISDIVAFCSDAINTISTTEDYHIKNVTDLILEYAEELQDEMDGKKTLKVETGYKALDHYIDGFREGNLITIAATSGAGKTTFSLNLLINMSMIQKLDVMLVCVEMSNREITENYLAAVLSRNKSLLKHDDFNIKDENIGKAVDAYMMLKNAGIQFGILCKPISRFSEIMRLIRTYAVKKPTCKVVVVDYIGLMTVDSGLIAKNSTRAYEIGYMTRALKNLAMELNIVIILLAQTNRNKDGDTLKQEKDLGFGDIRDSSSFVHDSNVVLLMKVDPNNNIARINIAKNRTGATGFVNLKFEKEIGKFVEFNNESRFEYK